MSSAAQPVEIIPEHGENHSGLLRKPFAFCVFRGMPISVPN